MLPEDEGADNKGEDDNHRLIREAEPGSEGEAGCGPDGAEGDIFRKHGEEEEAAPDDESDPPIDHNCDSTAGEDTLTALKVEHTGEHMSQEAEQAGPIFTQRNPAEGVAEQPRSQEEGENSFEHVAQDDDEGKRSAEHAMEVSKAGVTAAVAADIVLKDILRDNDSAVKAAEEVSEGGGGGQAEESGL